MKRSSSLTGGDAGGCEDCEVARFAAAAFTSDSLRDFGGGFNDLR